MTTNKKVLNLFLEEQKPQPWIIAMPLQIADIEQYKPQTPEEKKEFFRKKAIDIMNKIEEEMKNLLKEIKKENDDRLSHELEVANMFVSHIGNYRVYLSKERIPRKIT